MIPPVIDVGCAKLIIDGQVKIKQGAEIARVEGSRVCFTDGSDADTDALIFAYDNSSFIHPLCFRSALRSQY